MRSVRGVVCIVVLLATTSRGEDVTPAQPTRQAQVQPVAPSGPTLRQAIRAALERAARATKPDEALVRELAALFAALDRDDSLPRSERQSLARGLRNRLTFLGQQLQRAGASPILAQQAGPAGVAGAGPTPPSADSRAQELIDLIQATVAPRSWGANGGPGVVRYWRLGHAAVIHQSGDVHESVAHLLDDLR